MRQNKLSRIDTTREKGGTGETGLRSEPTTFHNKRRDPRVELVAQAFVSMVPLNSRAFQIREVSRGGMFLEFRDGSTAVDMAREHIEVGTDTEIVFALFMDGSRHTFNVRARIARITRTGIGVQFLTHNPPQLGALRDIFGIARGEASPPNHDPVISIKSNRSRVVLQKPADDSGWQDWELI